MTIRSFVPSTDRALSTATKPVDTKKFAKMEDNKLIGGKYLIARIREVCNTLHEVAKGPDALAANQVGITDRFYVALRENAHTCEDESCEHQTTYAFHEYINAEIVEASEDKHTEWESCFSYPDEVFLVERHNSVTIKFQNLIGGWQVEELTGIDAMVAQHEIDHLDGVRVVDICLQRLSYDDYLNLEDDQG